MSTIVTLGFLRQEVCGSMGEGDNTGTFGGQPGTQAFDFARFDPDGQWDGGWLQDTTLPGYPIARVNNWAQGQQYFQLYNALAGSPQAGDSYEVVRLLSFADLRRAINRGLALAGSLVRTLVRDETQTLLGGIYQYTPNYASGAPNQFFIQGVMQIDVQYNTGLTTAPWLPLDSPDWHYLDDRTIQLRQEVVDAYAGNPLRFTGYGPIGGRVATDNPTQVLATFDDDFYTEILIWACVHHGWKVLAAKQVADERSSSEANAQAALQQFQLVAGAYKRPTPFKRNLIVPTSPGWVGS